VTCHNRSLPGEVASRWRRRAKFAGVMTVTLAAPLVAQQPLASPGLRSPSLRLIQPPAGGSVPSDRPTVFYRYSSGEATDPIDDSSFQLWVDGSERTSGFRVGNGEAWGTLGAGKPVSSGTHLVIARVCSVRGICAAANDVVIAVPTAATPDDMGRRGAEPDSLHVRRHNHWKQPQMLIGDLLSNIVKLFRH